MRSEKPMQRIYCDRSDWTDDRRSYGIIFHTPHNQKILEQLLQYVQLRRKKKVRQNRS